MKTITTFIFLFNASILLAQNVNTTIKTNPQRVFNDTLLVFYGETIYFETTMNNDKIISYKQVNHISDSSKTIEIKVEAGFNGKNSTMMTFRNPFERELNYKAQIKADKKNAVFEPTSVIPISPKIFSMELWGFKAEAIMLAGIKFN